MLKIADYSHNYAGIIGACLVTCYCTLYMYTDDLRAVLPHVYFLTCIPGIQICLFHYLCAGESCGPVVRADLEIAQCV